MHESLGRHEMKSLSPDATNDIIEFAKRNPVLPQWSENIMRRFIGQLISSPDLLIDLHENGQRIATAILLDKIQNKGNHATFEVLGILGAMDKAKIIQQLLSAAKNQLPPNRSGIEITLHHSFPPHATFAERNQLTPYYNIFEMVNYAPFDLYADEDVILGVDADDAELYDVLVNSFQDNLDTSLPAFEDWKKGREITDNRKTWVVKKAGNIVGFLNLSISEDREAEIATIGVIKSMRQQGIAKRLIKTALSYLAENKISKCQLTVAVQNIQALSLYRSLGFVENEHYFVYKWCPSN